MDNHRVRRAQAKQDARKKTCPKHLGTHLVIKGTQTMCPQCYLDYIRKNSRGVFKNRPTEAELGERMAQYMKEKQEKEKALAKD